jgi:hypothetical protein
MEQAAATPAAGQRDPARPVGLVIMISGVYKADPAQYGTDDPAEMARIDQENLRDAGEALLKTRLREFVGDLTQVEYSIEPAPASTDSTATDIT